MSVQQDKTNIRTIAELRAELAAVKAEATNSVNNNSKITTLENKLAVVVKENKKFKTVNAGLTNQIADLTATVNNLTNTTTRNIF